MTRRLRLTVFAVGAAGVLALLVWGLSGLPAFGHFHGRMGRLLASATVPERKATSSVGVITFDFRGMDTLGEEFILFVAAVSVAALLRSLRRERGKRKGEAEHPVVSESVALAGSLVAAPLLLFGIYIVVHGHLTPGGGFQGGIVLMAALLVLYLTGAPRLAPLLPVEVAEGLGALAFTLIGIGGLIFAAAFFENFLPSGSSGLLTGGMVPLENIAVGIEVAGATTLILVELIGE